jgi:hypothetical protein
MDALPFCQYIKHTQFSNSGIDIGSDMSAICLHTLLSCKEFRKKMPVVNDLFLQVKCS